MPMNCPHCQVLFEITPQLYGQWVLCPGCSQPVLIPIPQSTARRAVPARPAIAAPANSAPSAHEDVIIPTALNLIGAQQSRYQEIPPEESAGWCGRWRDVWSGLMLLNVAGALWYVSLGVGALLFFRDTSHFEALGAGAAVITFGSLCGTVFGVLGLRHCAAIPQRTRAKGLVSNATYSGAAFVLAALLYFVVALLARITKNELAGQVAYYSAWFATGLGMITVPLVTFFLIRTAGYLNAQRLKRQIVIFIFALLTYPGLHLLLLSIMQTNAPEKIAELGLLHGMERLRYLTLVTSIGLGVWFIVLVSLLAVRIHRAFIVPSNSQPRAG